MSVKYTMSKIRLAVLSTILATANISALNLLTAVIIAKIIQGLSGAIMSIMNVEKLLLPAQFE